LDMPLRVQNKRVNTPAGLEIANIVRDHTIEPAHAVGAGQGNLGLIQPVNPASRNQGLELIPKLTRHTDPRLFVYCCPIHIYLIIAKLRYGSGPRTAHREESRSVKEGLI
jgi:hypothetical protein